MTKEEQKKIDEMIEQRMQEKSENMAVVEKTKGQVSEKSSGPLSMPNFIPQIDKNKEIIEQASDVVQIIGAQNATTNEEFMDKVSKNFQTGVLTEQEIKNMQKERLKEEQYWLKWQDVLKFVFIKSPHGLLFMRIMTFIAMLIYVPTRIVGMCIKTIGIVGDFINEIFNSVFGGKGKYLRDKDGNIIKDPKTQKPYMEKPGYNLFAKFLFGVVAVGLTLALVFVFVYIYTGFNIFGWFRQVL